MRIRILSTTHLGPVRESDPRAIVWRNLAALMEHHWGEIHLLRLATEARVAQSSVSRIKSKESSPTADMLHKLARVFRLQAWQLLDPRFDPKVAQLRAMGFPEDGAPTAWPFESISVERYAQLDLSARQRVEGFVEALLPPPTKGKG